MTARTAATRDGGQSKDAAAEDASASPSRPAASMLRLTALMLPLVLAGCAGSEQGLRDPSRLEKAVRGALEQRLMEANPREGSSGSPTHVRDVDCERESVVRYRCEVRFGDGTRQRYVVLVSSDGKRFHFS